MPSPPFRFPTWECALRSMDGGSGATFRIEVVRTHAPDAPLTFPLSSGRPFRVRLTLHPFGGAPSEALVVNLRWWKPAPGALIEWCSRLLEGWDGAPLTLRLGKTLARPATEWTARRAAPDRATLTFSPEYPPLETTREALEDLAEGLRWYVGTLENYVRSRAWRESRDAWSRHRAEHGPPAPPRSPSASDLRFPVWEGELRDADGVSGVAMRLEALRVRDPDAVPFRAHLTVVPFGGEPYVVDVYWYNTGLLCLTTWASDLLHPPPSHPVRAMKMDKTFARPQLMWRTAPAAPGVVRLEFLRSLDTPRFEPWFALDVPRPALEAFAESLWHHADVLDGRLFRHFTWYG